jgi:glyoxylase-like metal-dependent hydrolase (beta-lactamase superfamily II)
MELIPHFHWIRGLGSNIFLITGYGHHILVDTGIPRDIKRINKYLNENGLDVKDISSILITHADYDHAGAAAAVQAASGARIIASEKSAQLLTSGKSPRHAPPLLQFLLDKIHYPPVPEASIEKIGGEEFITDLDDWQAIPTPGHCDDHTSYYCQSEGLLFAGDAIFARGQLNIGPSIITCDQGEARKSAITLLKLAPAIIACGHGPPVMDHSADDILLLNKKFQS